MLGPLFFLIYVSDLSDDLASNAEFFADYISLFSVAEIMTKSAKDLNSHFVKSVRIRSYFGPHFPAFRLNTERYFLSLRIQSKCEKMRARITPNTDTFYLVNDLVKIIIWAFQWKINFNPDPTKQAQELLFRQKL